MWGNRTAGLELFQRPGCFNGTAPSGRFGSPVGRAALPPPRCATARRAGGVRWRALPWWLDPASPFCGRLQPLRITAVVPNLFAPALRQPWLGQRAPGS